MAGAILLRRCGGRPVVLPLPVPLLSPLTELGVLVTITVDVEREDTEGEAAPLLPEEEETTAANHQLLTSSSLPRWGSIALTVAAERIVPCSRVSVASMSLTAQRHTAARASVCNAQSTEGTSHRAVFIVGVAVMTAGRVAVGAAVVVVRITSADGLRELLARIHGSPLKELIEGGGGDFVCSALTSVLTCSSRHGQHLTLSGFCTPVSSVHACCERADEDHIHDAGL